MSGRKRKGVCRILKRERPLDLAEGRVKVKSTTATNKPQAGAATPPRAPGVGRVGVGWE